MLAISRVEYHSLNAVVVDDPTTNCVPLAIGARIFPFGRVTVAEETTIIAVVGEAGGCGVVPTGHTIKTGRLC